MCRSTSPNRLDAAKVPLALSCCSIFDTMAYLLESPITRPTADVETVKRGCMLAFGHAMTAAEGTSAVGATLAERGLHALAQRLGIALEDHRFWKHREMGVRKYGECALPNCSTKNDLKACSRCQSVACASGFAATTLTTSDCSVEHQTQCGRAVGPARADQLRDWKLGHKARCVRLKPYFTAVRRTTGRTALTGQDQQ